MGDAVYVIKKDTTLQQIGTILDTNSHSVNKIGVNSVDAFNAELLRYIRSDLGYANNVSHVIEASDIFGLVFYVMRWRRCTGYLVIQCSKRGVRYLCFLYSRIKHHGQSFGTSCEDVNIDDVKKAFIDNLPKCETTLASYASRGVALKTAIKNLPSNIGTSFGID